MNEDIFGWVIVDIDMLLDEYIFDLRGVRFGVEFRHVFCLSHRYDVANVQGFEQRNGAGCKKTNAVDQPSFYVAVDVESKSIRRLDNIKWEILTPI